MKGNDCTRQYPDGVWLPTEESRGSKYHAVKCNAHRLEFISDPTVAASRVVRNDLEPCQHCQEHHGLGSSKEVMREILPEFRNRTFTVGSPEPGEPNVDPFETPTSDGAQITGFPDLESLYPDKTTMLDDTDTIELTYGHAEVIDGDRATVTETATIPRGRIKPLLEKAIFQWTNHSKAGRWEEVKKHATRVEIEKVIRTDD